ncbi:MAG: phosphoglycolate phosphatase [Lysobacter sp.]|nr:MAG: phosphoglycolate phosphatase [Lysobacter sp.]
MTGRRFPAVVLFDLDGTLLDSAPDMLAAINAMRARRAVPAMALDSLRPHVSKGSRAMVAAAFPDVDATVREQWIPEFLEAYRSVLGTHGAPFDGVPELLDAIEAAGSRWGIVTNKPESLAAALMPMLGWSSRCSLLIGGDTLPLRKPDPLPLRVAAERLGIAPADCVYVGDDERDIVAARAAGMPSIAALWGYRLDGDDPAAWQADSLAGRPEDLLDAALWPR